MGNGDEPYVDEWVNDDDGDGWRLDDAIEEQARLEAMSTENQQMVVHHLKEALEEAENGYDVFKIGNQMKRAQFLIDDDLGLHDDLPF